MIADMSLTLRTEENAQSIHRPGGDMSSAAANGSISLVEMSRQATARVMGAARVMVTVKD